MKVSKLSFGALGILACLFSTVFILSSCKPDLSERDFVLSQKRDNRLIGSWKYIYSSPEDNDILIKEYTSAGDLDSAGWRFVAVVGYLMLIFFLHPDFLADQNLYL